MQQATSPLAMHISLTFIRLASLRSRLREAAELANFVETSNFETSSTPISTPPVKG